MSNRAERRRQEHFAKKYRPQVQAELRRREREGGVAKALETGARDPRILHVREGSTRQGALGTPSRPFACIRDAAKIAKPGDQIYVSGVYTLNETVTIPVGVRVRGTVTGEVETSLETSAATAEAIAKIAALQRGPAPVAANEAPPAPPEEPAPPSAPLVTSPPASRGDTRREEPAAAGPSSNPFAGMGDALAAAIGGKGRPT